MIGVDISGRSIKAVEVVEQGDLMLRTVCWSALGPDLIRRGEIKNTVEVAKVLQKTLASCSPAPLSGKDVIGSIPEVQSFVRVLELPLMVESEMDEAVQWAVRRHIPFDLDRVYIDWELLSGPRGQDHYQVLVGAAQRDVVDPLLAVFDALDLNVVALELEAQAVLRCLLPQAKADSQDVHGVLVIDLGATSTNVVFYDQGAMRYTASVQAGGDDLTQRLVDSLKVNPREAIDLKAKATMVGEGSGEPTAILLREGALELANKVERIVREMSVQLAAERRVRAVLLSGGGANLSGMVEVFAEVFAGIPVQLGNPWTNLSQGKDGKGVRLSNVDALHFTTALGLALRPISYIT